jgi:hypothetical protein
MSHDCLYKIGCAAGVITRTVSSMCESCLHSQQTGIRLDHRAADPSASDTPTETKSHRAKRERGDLRG